MDKIIDEAEENTENEFHQEDNDARLPDSKPRNLCYKNFVSLLLQKFDLAVCKGKDEMKTFYPEFLRACLHGGAGPQVGEATRLAVVKKWPAFTCKPATPGSRGDVIRRCCVVARHVNRENYLLSLQHFSAVAFYCLF